MTLEPDRRPDRRPGREWNDLPNEPTQSSRTPSPKRPIIAIDGPAGAGKSTVARHLASHFGLLNLETGAMYRAFALKAQAADVDPGDSSGIGPAGRAYVPSISSLAKTATASSLDGQDVTSQMREPAVTDGASRVSVHPQIRAWMVGLQQQLAAHGGVVMEGRDIGTVVFPHADVKIFLDAAPEVRGLRRYEQLGQSGQAGPASQQEAQRPSQPEPIIRELRERRCPRP